MDLFQDKSLKKRTSAPADVMAYNAELLANFEKEKKVLEERISELTKLTESRKGEIEKYKYEVKRLKDTVAAAQSSRYSFHFTSMQLYWQHCQLFF